MEYTYEELEPTSGCILRSDGAMFPKDESNRDYLEYLSSGAEAAPYVELPQAEPEPLTAEQKLARSGLTVDELKQLLGLTE